jgi:hypothetical protein
VVVAFEDQRGNEGDHGDPYRVGGIYGGYGNRLVKVLLNEPWPPRLLAALVAEFRAAGIDAAGLERLSPDRPLGLPWLEGAVRNFSTEARWGREAHISASVRLRSAGGLVLVEKDIQTRASGYNLNNFDEALLQTMLNEAFAEFVRKIARDPDITLAVSGHSPRAP